MNTLQEKVQPQGEGRDIPRITESPVSVEIDSEEPMGEMSETELGREDGEVQPTPAFYSSVRGISINPLNSGYMVKVGCQSVAVETTEKLVDMLFKYLSNPSDFEKKWYSKDVRNRLENI